MFQTDRPQCNPRCSTKLQVLSDWNTETEENHCQVQTATHFQLCEKKQAEEQLTWATSCKRIFNSFVSIGHNLLFSQHYLFAACTTFKIPGIYNYKIMLIFESLINIAKYFHLRLLFFKDIYLTYSIKRKIYTASPLANDPVIPVGHENCMSVNRPSCTNRSMPCSE